MKVKGESNTPRADNSSISRVSIHVGDMHPKRKGGRRYKINPNDISDGTLKYQVAII